MTTAASRTRTIEARLGETVLFRDHQGLEKAAIVTGTPESIDPGLANGEVPPITAADERHLMVFSPAGTPYPRRNIKQGDGPGQWSPLGGERDTQASQR